MSYREALQDKVPFGKDNKGFNVYYPPCNICGESVPNWAYSPLKTYVCKECKEICNEKLFEEKAKISNISRLDKLSAALSRISKKRSSAKYKTAIEFIKNDIGAKNWFQSIANALEKCLIFYHSLPAVGGERPY
ncbi:MAG: hypothetical protein LBR79_07245 [Oscillospiraceae bacterium]|nr:hypothetical protein [Oscillospiraceae bacterium]